MPHYPVVAQQEAEVMLPRKPNMWQYETFEVMTDLMSAESGVILPSNIIVVDHYNIL
jgi:hypothetical protein